MHTILFGYEEEVTDPMTLDETNSSSIDKMNEIDKIFDIYSSLSDEDVVRYVTLETMVSSTTSACFSL